METMETAVIEKSAAKNSAGNMRTRCNDKINISETFGKIDAPRDLAYFYNKRNVQIA